MRMEHDAGRHPTGRQGMKEERESVPDVVIHYAMGQDVLRELAPGIRERLAEAPYVFALYGPDPWFLYKPWVHGSGRGRTMHTRKTGEFLLSLAERARAERGTPAGEQLFSYLAGFVCHYTMDAASHPYIIWETTENYRQSQAHRAFEHTLDMAEMKRAGTWKGKHPVTDHYLPDIRLPEEMKSGLDSVYARVYGWQDAWRTVNRCFGLFRKMYRIMEDPSGKASALARSTGKDLLRGFCYSENYLAEVDAENTAHREWHSAYHPEDVYRTDFGEMRRGAVGRAVEIITAARQWVDGASEDPEGLRKIIGNDSYLSGLDAEDPRNWSIPSLSPARPEIGPA